jgi:hypothetical protein
MTKSETSGESHCANCGAPLSGGFCPVCGQSTTDYNVPVAQFAQEFVSETFDLDSRLLLTLKPLFLEPGSVPRDYVAGHRARFVPPVRLYLIASFAMFLMMSFGEGVEMSGDFEGTPEVSVELGREAADGAVAPATAPSATAAPPDADVPPNTNGRDALEQRIEDRFVQAFQRAGEDRDAFTDVFLSRMAQSMFLLLPLFALLLKVLYRRRLYVQHLVFAIYLHSFAFLLMTVVLLPKSVGVPWLSDTAPILLLWVPVYLLLALRTFYGESWLKSGAKSVVLSLGYMMVGGATMITVLLLSLLRM